MAESTQDTRPTELSDKALQTDTCDTIYVSKHTLLAYMIAVVQNTQSLQFEQMQITLQTAQNQASIETLLTANQFMSAHFNLAVLMDTPSCDNQVNAPKTEASAGPPSPSTSAANQETYHKTPYRSKGNHNSTK